MLCYSRDINYGIKDKVKALIKLNFKSFHIYLNILGLRARINYDQFSLQVQSLVALEQIKVVKEGILFLLVNMHMSLGLLRKFAKITHKRINPVESSVLMKKCIKQKIMGI